MGAALLLVPEIISRWGATIRGRRSYRTRGCSNHDTAIRFNKHFLQDRCIRKWKPAILLVYFVILCFLFNLIGITIFSQLLFLISSQPPFHTCLDIMTVNFVADANRGFGFAITKPAASRIPSAKFMAWSRSVDAAQRAVEQLRQWDLKAMFDWVKILTLKCTTASLTRYISSGRNMEF